MNFPSAIPFPYQVYCNRASRPGSPITRSATLNTIRLHTSTIIRVLSRPTARPYLFIILTRVHSDGEAMRFNDPSSCWMRAGLLSIPLPPADRATQARLRAAPSIAEQI